MQDLEQSEGLCPFEEWEERFEETFELLVCKEDGNEEGGSAGDDGPESEADGVVGEEVALFGGPRIGGGGRTVGYLVLHVGMEGLEGLPRRKGRRDNVFWQVRAMLYKC
jgi:hypothetical protein